MPIECPYAAAEVRAVVMQTPRALMSTVWPSMEEERQVIVELSVLDGNRTTGIRGLGSPERGLNQEKGLHNDEGPGR
jgi:hypothetical protein